MKVAGKSSVLETDAGGFFYPFARNRLFFLTNESGAHSQLQFTGETKSSRVRIIVLRKLATL